MDSSGLWVVLYVLLAAAGVVLSVWYLRYVFRVDDIVLLLRKIAEKE